MDSKPQTLVQALKHHAEKTPDKIFIHTRKQRYSYSDTLKISSSFAGFLADHNVSSGAKVCLLLPRRPELIFVFMGANMAGCIPAPVNYMEKNDRIQQVLTSIKPEVIVFDETAADDVVYQYIQQHNVIAVSTKNNPPFSQSLCWEQCLNTEKESVQHLPVMQDIAYHNYTTGTSGFPKGALCTHENIYWNTRSAVEAFHITKQDIHLCMFASFSHPHELFSRALHTGGSIVLITEINPKSIVRAINHFKVTCMMGLAVMYKMMALHCNTTELPSLRIAESGGMLTTAEIHSLFFDSFKIPVLSVWGSTETTGIALANTLENHRSDGSMGYPCPHYKALIVDDTKTPVPDGTIGELLISGPGVVSGYSHNVPFSSENGWYYTGDLVVKNKNGSYSFVERKNGMIKVAGLKVYPLQVELVLLQNPVIKEAAVIGVPDRRRGCVPKAFIVTENNIPLNKEKIMEFCQEHLAGYMIPKHFSQIDEMPIIGSGKINKQVLIDQESSPSTNAGNIQESR